MGASFLRYSCIYVALTEDVPKGSGFVGLFRRNSYVGVALTGERDTALFGAGL